MKVSIVIRTLNEGKYLGELLKSVESQEIGTWICEVIVVDSGSTDDTLSIAQKHDCKIVHITKEEFSFGRSLNIGCKGATGEALIIISGHCVPTNNKWIYNLCKPLEDGHAEYTYGRQIGGPESYYSECRIFEKYYPQKSIVPQLGFYCNNANSAILKSAWQQYFFDEDLTGLEDMELSQRLVEDGGKVAYIAEACVYHYHNETWAQVKRRFERESIALQKIMPQVHINLLDVLRYTISSILMDWYSAILSGKFSKCFIEIIKYRFFQYWGSYVGNHEHRKLSHVQKEAYFYPQTKESKYDQASGCIITHESQ
jgi:rhamnosyltransferase